MAGCGKTRHLIDCIVEGADTRERERERERKRERERDELAYKLDSEIV